MLIVWCVIIIIIILLYSCHFIHELYLIAITSWQMVEILWELFANDVWHLKGVNNGSYAVIKWQEPKRNQKIKFLGWHHFQSTPQKILIVMLLIYFFSSLFFIVIMSIENWIGFQSVYTRQYAMDFIDILSSLFYVIPYFFWYVIFTHIFFSSGFDIVIVTNI